MSDGPVWRLPEYTVHVAAAETMNGLPWQVADFKIDERIWSQLKQITEVVGIVDTGVGKKHLEQGELAGVVKDFADFTGSDYGPYDVNLHGSHVGGIVAAKSFGVARTVAQLVYAKALGDDGSGADRDIAKSCLYCVDKGATILNLSLGSGVPSPRINGVLKELAQQGVLVVVAAGNDGGAVNWPGALEEVLAVSAIDQRLRLASFSCRGPEIDVTAPGVKIPSLGQGLGFAVMSGTSMAAPWIAGYCANISAMCKVAGRPRPKTAAEWRTLLLAQSLDLGDAGLDSKFGVGLPDPTKFPSAAPAAPPAPVLPPPAVITEPGVRPAAFVDLTVRDAAGGLWRPSGWSRVA
jgi:hypothetical protein